MQRHPTPQAAACAPVHAGLARLCDTLPRCFKRCSASAIAMKSPSPNAKCGSVCCCSSSCFRAMATRSHAASILCRLRFAPPLRQLPVASEVSEVSEVTAALQPFDVSAAAVDTVEEVGRGGDGVAKPGLLEGEAEPRERLPPVQD